MLRTRDCGSLRTVDVGARVTLAGWVDRRRDHGGLIFIDLRDRYGVTQLVFNPETSPAPHQVASQMRGEYVVQVEGEVTPRPAGTENRDLPTGEIEVVAATATILNRSETPPFSINQDAEVDENVRLRYRYLDLRRSRPREHLMLRHRVVKYMRAFLDARDFIEIETPILIKSTPEGARDYLVPSRVHPGKFYALPQSPQQLKQLLMVAGIDRYYQIAKCFRDEDSRADRQPEHTQLDIEMSFVEEDDILALIEELFTGLIKEVKPEMRVNEPWPRLQYEDAMARFGSDKPDLRFGLELHDLSDIVAESGFGVFRDTVAGGGRVRGVSVPGCAGYSRSQLQELNDLARSFGAPGLVTMALSSEATDIAGLTMEQVKSVAAKFLVIKEVRAIAEYLEASPGDLILIVAGEEKLAGRVLGELRREMGRRLELADPNLLAFAFVQEFPLLRWDEEVGRWDSEHHPFTAPRDEDIPLLDSAPEKAHSKHYDIVCNGLEMASGSIRIHDPELQATIFRLLGYTDDEIQQRFGPLLEAFRYGAPPHGGIAPGIDRLVMILAGEETIREVIAFPKNQSAVDLTLDAPSPVGEEQLAELHLRLRED